MDNGVFGADGGGRRPPGKKHVPAGLVWVANALAFALVLIAGRETVREARAVMCFDFYQAWVAATALREGDTRDVYTVEARVRLDELYDQKALEYVGPSRADQQKSRRMHAAYVTREIRSSGTPTFYAAMALFAGEDYDRDQFVWQCLSIACLAVATALFARRLGYPWALTGVAVAFFAAVFLPARSGLWVGNVNRVQLGVLAAIGLTVWSRVPGRHVVAGVMIGVLTMWKPNLAALPLCVGVGWAVTRQFRRLIHGSLGIVTGVLAAFLLPGAYFGVSGLWPLWLAQLSSVRGSAGVATGNLSQLSPVRRLVPGSAGSLLEMGLLAALLGLALAVSRRGTRGAGVADLDAPERGRLDVFLLGVGGAVSVLSAPIAWMHYFVLLVPLALVALHWPSRAHRWFRTQCALWSLALVAVACVAQFPPFLFVDPAAPAAARAIGLGAYGLLVVALARCALSAHTTRGPRGES